MQEHDKSGRFVKGTKIKPENHPRWTGGLPNCIDCGAKLSTRHSRTKRCRQCFFKFAKGPNALHWKGGIKYNPQGYRLIHKSSHPNADQQGYVREHRLVIEESIGRYLESYEIVHHLNGDKLDNKLKNLVLMTKSEHDKHHMIKNERDSLGRIRG